MRTLIFNLSFWLQAVAALQLFIAVLNLFLTRMLRWQDDLARMPLLIREVFHVHAWFISVTLAIFSVMTLQFAAEMAAGTNEACRWLAGGIGCFWALRTVLQVTYYSSSHWRGLRGRTIIHVILLAMYGGMAGVYLRTAFGANGVTP